MEVFAVRYFGNMGILLIVLLTVTNTNSLSAPAPVKHFGYYFQVQHPPAAPASGYSYGGSETGSGYSYNSPYVTTQRYSYQQPYLPYPEPPSESASKQWPSTSTHTQILQAALPLSTEVGIGQVQIQPQAQAQPYSHEYENVLPLPLTDSWPRHAQSHYFGPWTPQSQPRPPPPPRPQQEIPANLRFRIGVISYLDQDSVDGDGKLWHSYLKEGNLDLKRNVSPNPDLSRFPRSPNPEFSGLQLPTPLANVSVIWDDDSKLRTIKSGLAYSGRGMELSTLNWFNGKLYACDDKTGVVYELPVDVGSSSKEIKPIPWAILADGNFQGPNGFKCEWGTIKDGDLWIGGHGKHIYNSSGVPVNSNDRFVKQITPRGEVTHLDWSENFDKMATSLGVHMPGYVIHEAAGWSDALQKWVFMPRKVSKTKFNPVRDIQSGSSIMLIADPDFNSIEVVQIGSPEPFEGFSGFKFIPGTSDQYIVALKTTTKETKDDLKSFIMAFDLSGRILMNETEIAPQKYEAIEFL